MQPTSRIATTIALATFMLSGAAIASAAGSREQAAPERTVRHDDLNLSTPAGAAVLYRRIRNAAFDVCREMIPINRC